MTAFSLCLEVHEWNEPELTEPRERQAHFRADLILGPRLEIHGDGRESDELAEQAQAPFELFDGLSHPLELALDGERVFDLAGLREQRLEPQPHGLRIFQANLEIGELFGHVAHAHLAVKLVTELAHAPERALKGLRRNTDGHRGVVSTDEVSATAPRELLDGADRVLRVEHRERDRGRVDE